MQLKVIRELNTRIGGPSRTFEKGPVRIAGEQLEVAGIIEGEEIDGNNIWYRTGGIDDHHYWSGGVTPNMQTLAPAANQKNSFGWFKSLGIENIWQTYNEHGEHVKIAVLDTGYRLTCPDVSGAIQSSGIFTRQEHYPGIALIIDDQSTVGHGTRCCSIIGSQNNSQWIVGIAPKCTLITGKISIDTELYDMRPIIDGIDWAIKQGADIISISFSKELTNQQEIKNWEAKFDGLLTNNKVLIFAAAGNTSEGASGERYPASFANCISVGATDAGKRLSTITLLSSRTILHAPGVDIESWGAGTSPDAASGTSFSTPIVAAVTGLAISYLRKRNISFTPQSLLADLINSADDIVEHPSKKIINIETLFTTLKNKS